MSPEHLKIKVAQELNNKVISLLDELHKQRPEICELIDYYLFIHKDNSAELTQIKEALCFENFSDESLGQELDEDNYLGLLRKHIHGSSTFRVTRVYDNGQKRWLIEKLALRHDWPDTFTPADRLEETRRLLSELRLANPEAFKGFLLEDQPHIAELIGKIATIAK